MAAATLWNKFPLSIRSAKDVNCFKSFIKIHLVVQHLFFSGLSSSIFCLFFHVLLFHCALNPLAKA